MKLVSSCLVVLCACLSAKQEDARWPCPIWDRLWRGDLRIPT